jgi:predicted RNase H-like nuclease
MAVMASHRVLGVDACSHGWIAIALTGDGVRAYQHADIAGIVGLALGDGTLDVIGIDIPIGLADAGLRQADVLARAAAGPRRASVFMPPVRAALAFGTHAEASAANRRLTGRGVSRQSFNLTEKILQVDRWRERAPCPVLEVHPELSFAALAGGEPMESAKSTWAGAVRRRQLLAAAGLVLPDDLGPAGQRAGTDDVLDAAAVAWTARRYARGEARRLPPETAREVFSDGIDCAIWT